MEDREKERLEMGELRLEKGFELISVIGEIEGHENLSGNTKTTRYEHLLPRLAALEDSRENRGILILINTIGGDVSCGLALAEMIASMSCPTVSLVIGDSHSIGVPLAAAADYSFIAPTATMMIHPVRLNGLVIGAQQTARYFKMMQDRILDFVSSHSSLSRKRMEELMMNTEQMTRDLGTVLVGEDAVQEGLIDEIGGIGAALRKLHFLAEEKKKGPVR